MKRVLIMVVCLFVGGLFAQELYDVENITTVELTFSESNWDEILDDFYEAGDEERLTGSALVNGVEFESVGVRYKGNSSYNANNEKNPLNIKLDYIIDDQLYDGYGTLKLANGYNDPTFVRETLGYEIARTYMPASLANYAKVYINGSYIGLYTSVQDVDKYFKNMHLGSNYDIRFKGELASGALPNLETIWGYFGADSTDYVDFFELKSDTGWDDLINFFDIFNNQSEDMESVLNIDNHLWMLVFDNLTVNLDSPINFAHNYYLYKDDSNRFNPIIWDLNEGFGGFSMLLNGGGLSTYQLQHLDPLLNINDDDFPIIGKVLENDTYQKMYIAHMRTMIEEIFDSGWYETRAYELQDIIAEEYQNDPNVSFSYSQFVQNVTSSISMGPGPQGISIIGLTELMNTRCNWLLTQSEFSGDIPQISSPELTPEDITPGTTVWVTTEAIDSDELYLYSRSDYSAAFEASQMFDDGEHNDGDAGDGVFGTSIVAGYHDIQYYFYAQNDSQGCFLPARAAYEFYTFEVTTETGNIVINEINYNSSDDFDPGDWVELYNPDEDDLDISGWMLKDENDDHVFNIPVGTTLNGGEYLVLCVDSDAFSLLFPEVTNYIGDIDFGFSGSGELIRIFDASGTIIDFVNYDDEGDWPLLPDGEGSTLELIDPSYDNDLPESWQDSMGNGTPGELNSNGVAVTENEVVGFDFQLSNYPNPFNPTTTITYKLLDVEDDSEADLTIYNSKGQKVKGFSNLSNKSFVVWDGKDSNGNDSGSGIYFYILRQGEVSQSSKMVLIK